MAQAVYTQQDSLQIEDILQQKNREPMGNSICNIATMFIGTPYVAGTLDKESCERLTINTHQFDCTTFVETTVALALTASQKGGFSDFCNNLQSIRYRNSQCNSYSDRLHYISQWVDENSKKGVVKEIITTSHTATQKLNLSFMSSHPNSYSQLKDNPKAIKEISTYEAPYRNIELKYIPKHLLNRPQTSLDIEDGDILAIVTGIKGLDVTHVGFAKWINGKLHLIHASSGKGKVILDSATLFNYMKSKKNNLGIRVIRVKNIPLR